MWWYCLLALLVTTLHRLLVTVFDFCVVCAVGVLLVYLFCVFVCAAFTWFVFGKRRLILFALNNFDVGVCCWVVAIDLDFGGYCLWFVLFCLLFCFYLFTDLWF